VPVAGFSTNVTRSVAGSPVSVYVMEAKERAPQKVTPSPLPQVRLIVSYITYVTSTGAPPASTGILVH
jgi:hypothetical protein